MKKTAIFLIVFILIVGCATREELNSDLHNENPLQGSWILIVENLQHKSIMSMVVEFSNEQANSCMSGNWKRVRVISFNVIENKFSLLKENLSYELKSDNIVIGSNEICDAYLHLTGKFQNSQASGDFVTFGIEHFEKLGYFTLNSNSE